MSGWWAAVVGTVTAVSLFFALILAEACKDVMKEEARTRIERLPFALLRLASRRLPDNARNQILHEEWQPELHYIIAEPKALPLTRLIRGSRFSLSLLRSARRIGTDLADVRGAPTRLGDRDDTIAIIPTSSMIGSGIATGRVGPGAVIGNRLYLNVPYQEKDDAKRLFGARWDARLRLWHVDATKVCRSSVERWLP